MAAQRLARQRDRGISTAGHQLRTKAGRLLIKKGAVNMSDTIKKEERT